MRLLLTALLCTTLLGVQSQTRDDSIQQIRNNAKWYDLEFTDGRDTDPKSGLGFLTDLQNHLDTTAGKIATITGRYYAMDRDKRWEQVNSSALKWLVKYRPACRCGPR